MIDPNLIVTIVGSFIAVGAWFFPREAKKRQLETPSQIINKQRRVDKHQSILATKKLKVGYFHYPPFIKCPENPLNENPSGLYATLLQKAVETENLSIEWHLYNLGDAIHAVNSGEVDIFNCIFQTAVRAENCDFTAFLHSVAVGGVALRSYNVVRSQADLSSTSCRVVVCKGEIGHEFAEKVLKIPKSRLTTIDTQVIANICSFVQTGHADIALADSISCQNWLNENSNSKPAMKPIFRRVPLYICQTGIMLPREQLNLAKWLETKIRICVALPEIIQMESEILDEYHGIIHKLL
jgi:hypothetical protein